MKVGNSPGKSYVNANLISTGPTKHNNLLAAKLEFRRFFFYFSEIDYIAKKIIMISR